MMRKERKQYTAEYNREALRLAEQGYKISDAAHNLGIHGGMLGRWLGERSKGFCRKVFNCFVGFPGVGCMRFENRDLKGPMLHFKGCHYGKEIVLLYTRWYLTYPLSYIEEMMQERGVEVDHPSLNRWVLKYTPFIEKEFQVRWLQLAHGQNLYFGQWGVEISISCG